MKPRIKGRFTFRSAGVLFVLSAVLELFSINSRVPLFGDIQGGIVAAAYHLVYAGLYVSLGFGLYTARPWAYPLVFAATGFYTLDRIVYILDRKALETYLAALLNKYGLSVGTLDTGFILKVVSIAAALTVLCWWGFAGYAYLRRQYFQRPPIVNEAANPDGP